MQKMSDNIKRSLRNWLNIRQSESYNIRINEVLDFELSAIRNRIWYRGDGNELEQMYQQSLEYTDKNKFWASRSTPGMDMRKIHTGLPGLIVRTLTAIVMPDMGDLQFDNPEQEMIWTSVAEENKFRKLLEQALKETLFIGDGAFKITINTDISDIPILEWFPGERVEIVREYGRLKEVVFKTPYNTGGKQYVLLQHYGYGYVKNELFEAGKRVDISILEEVDEKDIAFDESLILAVPLLVYESAKFEGRGGSILDGKSDSFDAFDEAWSQWMDALRKGRATRYIPEDLIPRDANGGELLKPNPFDNTFIKIKSGFSEDGGLGIDIQQPDIPHDSYLASYVTALDLCLQGVISPSTLGIDMKKLDNAEAQREKEKATLYTRNAIVDALQETLPVLVEVCINAYNLLYEKALEEVTVDIPFGEYANPSFESQVETVAKGKQGGIMSIEASVEELYGSSRDDDWKAAEVVRLKAEQGIMEMEEPAVGAIESEEAPSLNLLNGAQIGSLMNVIKMVKEGSVTRSEAISIITATLGISRENAESFIEEGISNASQSSKSNLSNASQGI